MINQYRMLFVIKLQNCDISNVRFVCKPVTDRILYDTRTIQCMNDSTSIPIENNAEYNSLISILDGKSNESEVFSVINKTLYEKFQRLEF